MTRILARRKYGNNVDCPAERPQLLWELPLFTTVTLFMALRILILCFVLSPVFLPASSLLPAFSTAYDPLRDPFADGRAAIKLARESGRRVLIEVGGDWCSWCHKLDAFIKANPDVYRQLHSHFVILKVNVSEENDNHAFMQGLPKSIGYPKMFVADGEGKIIYTKDTAEFLQDKQYSRQRFLAFIEQWKQP